MHRVVHLSLKVPSHNPPDKKLLFQGIIQPMKSLWGKTKVDIKYFTIYRKECRYHAKITIPKSPISPYYT
jgi:hypothetical protein